MNHARQRQPFVRPDVERFLHMLAQIGGPEMSELPLADARAAFLQLQPVAEAEPRPLAVIRDLACPGPAGEIGLRLYDARASREPGPAVVFYHGGGFVLGNLDSHHNLCTEIAAELDLPVVAIDYRLAPEHPFPAAPDDAEAATRWVASNPEVLERKITGLVLMGDSAGGNLTIVTTQALVAAPVGVPVLAQAPLYAATDDITQHDSYHAFGEGYLMTKQSMDWFTQAYAAEPGHPRLHPKQGDHCAMPPTVMVTAGLDPSRDSGRAYAAELILAGSEVIYLEMQGTIHGFCTFRKALPSARKDMDAIFAAIRLILERGN